MGQDTHTLRCSAKLEGDHLHSERREALLSKQQKLFFNFGSCVCDITSSPGPADDRLRSQEEVDHQRHLRRLLHCGVPHRKAWCRWHQLAACGEGHAWCGDAEDEVLGRMVFRHNLHHLRRCQGFLASACSHSFYPVEAFRVVSRLLAGRMSPEPLYACLIKP